MTIAIGTINGKVANKENFTLEDYLVHNNRIYLLSRLKVSNCILSVELVSHLMKDFIVTIVTLKSFRMNYCMITVYMFWYWLLKKFKESQVLSPPSTDG